MAKKRKIAFVGSECYPFVKTGGLGDVMYALPRALVGEECEVRVILPLYACIPQKYKDQMKHKGSFMMDLTLEGRTFFVGIMELEMDGVIYDFVENKEFFDWGNPYTGLWEDIPKYCYFSKASLAILNYLEWAPDIIHCHDWQASLVPLYKRTKFWDTPVGAAKTVLTIHNLRFQGICSFKGGIAFADRITTVSETYAQEIQTGAYGEGLDAHLRYHSPRLSGIVNGIDVGQWDPAADQLLAAKYDVESAIECKKSNKLALQEKLGLDQDENKMVLGLVSRLTDQKGLDLVNAVFEQMMDSNTQMVVLGTGDPRYENAFRYYEGIYKGSVCAYISYNEKLAHLIYAGADAFLVPSLFEPCGLTQLIAMHYGTVPIVRETGGLKDTVLPFCGEKAEGNGFTFDQYDANLLLGAVNEAKNVYFADRSAWDEMVKRNMRKDVSWVSSADKYLALYDELIQ